MKIVLAVLAAVVLGLPAALVTRTAAEALQPDPDPAAAAAVIYPGVPMNVEDDPFVVDEPGWLRFMMARGAGSPHAAPRDPVTVPAAEARARAEAAGWRLEDGLPDSYEFAAVKGGARMDVYDSFLVVHKAAAWWVLALAVLGGLLGAALGAWLALRAARLLRQKSPRSRTAIRETAVVGVALIGPALAQSLVQLSGATDLPLPYSATLLLDYARWPAALGVLVLAGALVALRFAGLRPSTSS